MAEQPQEITITIAPPDEITGRIWNAFAKARQDYINAKERAGETSIPTLMANYAGSLAVIRGKWFKIDAPPKFQTLLDTDPDDLPMAFIGFICSQVADPINASVNLPLASWASRLSPTT